MSRVTGAQRLGHRELGLLRMGAWVSQGYTGLYSGYLSISPNNHFRILKRDPIITS